MLLCKQKKSQGGGGNRLLISITVLGSAGPIRFVVGEEELVGAVIETALKSYAREGRLPVLGSKLDDFILYCPIAGTEALSPWKSIGSIGVRNFMLFKKRQTDEKASIANEKQKIVRKGHWCWRAWFNKSLNLRIPSH